MLFGDRYANMIVTRTDTVRALRHHPRGEALHFRVASFHLSTVPSSISAWLGLTHEILGLSTTSSHIVPPYTQDNLRGLSFAW